MLLTLLKLLTFHRVSCWELPDGQKAVALAWLGGVAALALPSFASDYPYFSLGSQAFELGMALCAGLVAAWLVRQGAAALRFAFAFIAVAFVAILPGELSWLAAIFGEASYDWLDPVMALWAVAAVTRFTLANAGWQTGWRKVTALLVPAMVLLLGLLVSTLQIQLAMAAASAAADDESFAEIDQETLWTAQPGLLDSATEGLDAPSPGGRAFVVTVAAGGYQDIFGREAHAIRERLEQGLGPASRALTLSNARKDLPVLPMANRTNLAAVLADVARDYDPRRDIAVLYLTAHGGKDASLATNLPNYTDLKPLSADFLAQTLDKLGIARRIVVVSACYSGTWIAPLASPDTITLTASSSDRTSFGCDDEREFTLFGDAMNRALARPDRSLADSFVAAKSYIAQQEAKDGVSESRPQSDVGVNMQAVWRAPLRCLVAGARDCAAVSAASPAVPPK